MNKKIITLILIILTILTIFCTCLYLHEYKHYNTFINYGCKKVDINFIENHNLISINANCNNLDQETQNFLKLAIANQENDYLLFMIILLLMIIIIINLRIK